nr:unnamed protein product [Callosobruchus chinensis]
MGLLTNARLAKLWTL